MQCQLQASLLCSFLCHRQLSPKILHRTLVLCVLLGQCACRIIECAPQMLHLLLEYTNRLWICRRVFASTGRFNRTVQRLIAFSSCGAIDFILIQLGFETMNALLQHRAFARGLLIQSLRLPRVFQVLVKKRNLSF
mmetsp:Transcript_12233/g.38074  ORF Transcript_12233/g.38074 Transcript_12233/m.38074 type:complete len:136 (-) Transcript_12233:736-1143(-)